jgi:hypothetical protein
MKEFFVKIRLSSLIAAVGITVVSMSIADAADSHNTTLACPGYCPSSWGPVEVYPVFYSTCPSGYTPIDITTPIDYYSCSNKLNSDTTGTFTITQCSYN